MHFFLRNFVVRGRGCLPGSCEKLVFFLILLGEPPNYTTFHDAFSKGMKTAEENAALEQLITFSMLSFRSPERCPIFRVSFSRFGI